jgi:ABC-type transport system involved in cytochrome c biogenesis permease component
MERLLSVLVLCLLVAVIGVGVVVYVAAEQAADDRSELACIERAHATATIAMLAPTENVDPQGRLDAIAALGKRIDAC